MFTMEDWNGSFLQSGINEGDEISEEVYFYFLECVPPRLRRKNGFLTGEPYTHNDDGDAVYMAFTTAQDKFFYVGLKTIKEMIQ